MTMRSIDTRFWKDNWARSVNPLDRYLFLYLLTNNATTWCGVYELPIDVIAFETGIDRDELKVSMLPRLVPKAIYFDGWVYIPNWVKYHMSESGNMSPQQQKGYEKAWEAVPDRIRLKIKEVEKEGIPYTYPIRGVSASSSAFTLSSISKSYDLREEPDDEIEKKPKTPPKYPHSKEVFSWFPKPEASWKLNTTELKHAELLWERGEERVRKAITYVSAHKDDEHFYQVTKPSDLERKWEDIKQYAGRN